MDFAFNIAGKLVWLALKPQNWVLLLLVLTAISVWRGRLRAARRRVTLLLGLMLALTALPMGDYLVGRLEATYPVNPDLTGIQGVVVLGGSEDYDGTIRTDQVQLNWAGERLAQTVALARRYPDIKVVFTGGTGALSSLGRDGSEADIAARFFDEMGLDMSRVTLEPNARNTTENARLSAELVDPTQKWALVTSAFHMPRSVESFERAGWTDIVAYPVDYNARPVALDWDFIAQMDLMAVGVREYLGRLAYWAAGR